jgi:hypothetical protein
MVSTLGVTLQVHSSRQKLFWRVVLHSEPSLELCHLFIREKSNRGKVGEGSHCASIDFDFFFFKFKARRARKGETEEASDEPGKSTIGERDFNFRCQILTHGCPRKWFRIWILKCGLIVQTELSWRERERGG